MNTSVDDEFEAAKRDHLDLYFARQTRSRVCSVNGKSAGDIERRYQAAFRARFRRC